MKKKIALLTGGYSGEAAISYKSTITVSTHIDKEKFEVYIIDITQQGWYYKTNHEQIFAIDKNDFSLTLHQQKIKFDAVLLCIHGTPGEDGKLQGYFDMLGLPYTSCNATTSAITFNKSFTNAVAAFGGLQVAKSVLLIKGVQEDVNAAITTLQFPVFVKPNNGGSSIGMSKVYEPALLQAAVEKAFKEDTQVLIEEFIEGREFTIGVFKTKGNIITLPITEIISKNDFFDFGAKYLGESEEITPAPIEEAMANQIRAAAKKAYELLNCSGIVRIDFIYSQKQQQPFMLEINTVPGQSEASIVPQQVKAMGWSLQEFYTAVIEECFN